MRHFKPLIIPLLLVCFGCQYLPWGKPAPKPIFVGEPESILVEPPEDAFDVSYRWSIPDLPDESVLVPDFSSSSNVFTFTADVIGDYIFAVSVESYGVEVEDHILRFIAMEDTSLVPRERVSPEVAARMISEAAASSPAAKILPPTILPILPSAVPKPTPTAVPKPAPTAAPKPAAPSVTRAKSVRKTYASDSVPGHYTIQVSSWKTVRQAQAVLQQLADQGYDAYIQRILLEDRNEVWWRVRMGDFTDVDEARKMRDGIAVTFDGAWVDNVRKEVFDESQ